MEFDELVQHLLFMDGSDEVIQPVWIKAIEEYLNSGGSISASTRNNGWQIIHVAAANQLTDVVEWLTKKGVDIDVKDERGQTPLMLAFITDIDNPIQYGGKISFTSSKRLLELGANPDVVDDFGLSIESIAKDYGRKIYSKYKEVLNSYIRESRTDGVRLD